MDKIIAKGLSFTGCHGILPAEKTTPQRFIVDLELWLDLKPAARNDDLTLTVNYDHLFHQVERIVQEECFDLIETLAETIAQKILTVYPVEAVEITVYKPQAPVSGNFDHFAVKMIRFRQ